MASNEICYTNPFDRDYPDGFGGYGGLWPRYDNPTGYEGPLAYEDPRAADYAGRLDTPHGLMGEMAALDEARRIGEIIQLDRVARAMAPVALASEQEGIPSDLTTTPVVPVESPWRAPAARARWLNDLKTRPFHELVTEEFGREAADALLAVADDHQSSGEQSVKPGKKGYGLQTLQSHYSSGLAFEVMRTDGAVTRYGLPVEWATTPADAKYCRDFLALMEGLGFPGSVILPPATLNPRRQAGLDAQAIASNILQHTEPIAYENIISERRRYSVGGHNQEYEGFVKALAQQAAAGAEPNVPDNLLIRGYPLRPLNERGMLYLCEDGGLRVYTEDGWLPAPTPRTSNHVWGLDIDPARVVSDFYHVRRNQRYASLPDSEHFFRSVDAYPPRERLLDIAGHALGATCQTDRLRWHEEPYGQSDQYALSCRWVEF